MLRPAGEGPTPPRVAGYVLHERLGAGAYGEVWLGEHRITRRQVAVKLLRSAASLDWSLLDAETEKLAFLAADRRVVQLLDVGRDADPPYFVMEYVSRGSLARHLEESGPLPLDRAVELFEEIALGLAQVHRKGILHCDLKPSNVLLDDELRPRLADFGQARLLEDRSPARALGTMFFMAPEQATLPGVPDARWDIYALGAILHSLITGIPPHRTEEALALLRAEPDLSSRLARYRQLVSSATTPPRPRGLDKPLTNVLARCLAPDPGDRFSTVEEIVGALRARRRARGRRPIMWLGVVGPLVLLAVMGLFGVRGYREAMHRSADAIRQRAFESNKFAAASIARSLETEVRRYFDMVSEEAVAPGFAAAWKGISGTPELQALTAADPEGRGVRDAAALEAFLASPARVRLDRYLQDRLDGYLEKARQRPGSPRFVGVSVVDAQGTMLSSVYDLPTIRTKSVGRYYAWRTYFHGGPVDQARDTPRARVRPVDRPHLSAPWASSTTSHWRLGISVPLFDGAGESKTFAGVLVFAVDVGDFGFLEATEPAAHDRFAVLVDAQGGQGSGRILFHPALTRASAGDPQEPGRQRSLPFVPRDVLARAIAGPFDYEDPLERDGVGTHYRGTWIAAAQPLALQPHDGLMVLVQERSAGVTGPVEQLGRHLMLEGILALLAIAISVPPLWFLALGRRETRSAVPRGRGAGGAAPVALRDRTTMSERSAGNGSLADRGVGSSQWSQP